MTNLTGIPHIDVRLPYMYRALLTFLSCRTEYSLHEIYSIWNSAAVDDSMQCKVSSKNDQASKNLDVNENLVKLKTIEMYENSN